VSIARLHRQKTLAAKEVTDAKGTGNLKGSSQYELMLAQLLTHQRQLSQIQSMERRAATKAELLPEYAAYVEGVLSADTGIQDDVLMTVMVWRIDAGDLNGALDIGEYALNHKLKMPERFNRDTATLIAEEMAEAVLSLPDDASINESHPCDSPRGQHAAVLKRSRRFSDAENIQHVIELTQDSDMPDEVRSKLHKAMGLILQESNPKESVEHLSRSLKLNPRAGVKKLLEKLQKQVTTDTD